MAFKNVLVPFDGSEQAQHAVDAALELAAGVDSAKVTVLHVAPEMDFDDTSFDVAAEMVGIPALDDKDKAQLKEKYQGVRRQQLHEKIEQFFESVPENIEVVIEIENGKPHEVIESYVREHDIDCVVMGRRGMGRIRQALGSVSAAVLRTVDVPVLVVK